MAYRHIHNLPAMTAVDVVVAGKEHKVKHSTNPKRIKIDSAQRKKESKSRQASVSKREALKLGKSNSSLIKKNNPNSDISTPPKLKKSSPSTGKPVLLAGATKVIGKGRKK